MLTGHIGDDLTGFKILDDSSFGDFDHKILAVLSVTALLSALFSAGGDIFSYMAEISKGVQSLVNLEDNISAAAAISAVRAAIRYLKLPAEADMSVSAFSGFNKDFCTVCEHVTFPF